MFAKPKWWDEYVIEEPNNFHLKEGTPKEIVQEFEELMNNDDD